MHIKKSTNVGRFIGYLFTSLLFLFGILGQPILVVAQTVTLPQNFTLGVPVFSCVSGVPQVLATWTPSVGAVSYTLSHHGPANVGWPQIGINLKSTTFVDKVLQGGAGVYSYQIKATSASGGVRYSNIQSATVGKCPVGTTTPPPTTPVPAPTPIPSYLPSTTTNPPPPPATPVSFTQPKWGAYVGWQENALAGFESQVGKSVDHRAVFIHWGNESAFPSYLAPYVKDKGKALIIFWEATDYNNGSVNQPRFSYDAILRGDWDNYFRSFAASAKAYGGEVILVPFSEMNGDWFPISGTKNGNSAAKHNAAYQKIRGFFRDATNVKFGWAPNNDSVPNIAGNQIKDYYPGDAYVDIVGVDGFNFGNGWMTFSQVFNNSLAILKTYKKPIYIFSFASAAGPAKAEWIRDAIDVQIPKHPEIKGWVWFNENKEQNWLVSSDPASLTAFRTAIQ